MVKHLLTAVAVVASALSLSSSVHAESFALHFDGGAVVPYAGSQVNTFKVGVGADASALWLIGRNLAIGPQVAAFNMEPREGQNYREHSAQGWNFEAAVRAQGDHTKGWVQPWIGVSGGAALIGRLAEPVIDGSVGLDLATNDSHDAWIGVYAKVSHTFLWEHGNNTNAITHGDTLDTITFGVSGTFDFAPKKAPAIEAKPTIIREFYYTETKVVEKPVIVTQAQGTDDVGAPAAPNCDATSGKVYFDRDQSALDWSDRDTLDGLVATMKANPEVKVTVVGNASQDHSKLTAAQAKHDAELAAARGQAVVKYLTSKGIDASRISLASSASGSGDNASQEARERNRNATIKVEVLTK